MLEFHYIFTISVTFQVYTCYINIDLLLEMRDEEKDINPDNPTPVTMQGKVPISINYMMMLHKHIHVHSDRIRL